MIIFLYGQNSYGASKKLVELKRGYEAKNPNGFNSFAFDFSEKKPEEFFEAARAGSLVSEKKLIVLKNVFSAGEEAVLKFLKSQKLAEREDVILIIAEFGEPSAKNKLFNYLVKKPCQSQNFKPLKNYEIKEWAKKLAASFGAVFTGEALDFLIAGCGGDLWRIDSEIRKIADFSGGKIIGKPQVEEIVVLNGDYKIFALTDALAKKDRKKALENLHKALENGEKPAELLGLLAWQIRNLLRFKSDPENAADLKLHPFVLEKTREAAKFYELKELRGILAEIIKLDLDFKTGAADEKTALSLLIAGL